MIPLLNISPQSSCPPSIARFLRAHPRQHPLNYNFRGTSPAGIDIPQRSRSLNHNFVNAIRQPLNQLPHDVSPLEQTSGGRVVLDQVADRCARPGPVGVFWRLELHRA
jgi:hypothetical protein